MSFGLVRGIWSGYDELSKSIEERNPSASSRRGGVVIMNRLFWVAVLSTIAIGGAYAGAIVPMPIDLTKANGGATILNVNIASDGFIPCVSGTTTNNKVCTTSNTTTNPLPSGGTSFTPVLYNGVPVPFDIASGGADSGTGAGDTNDVWAPGAGAGNKSKTIDVGVYGTDQIWTMLNDIDGTVGYQGITLTLSGTEADMVTPITETIYLTAGVDYRSIAGATVPGDPTACDIANIGTATPGMTCAGHTSTTTPSVGTDSNYNATNVANGVSITVYNDIFATTDSLGNNYWLDAQDINLGGAFLNGWLNTITITSNDGSSGNSEKAILSAVTVDAVAPEPGTVVLFTVGMAGLAFFHRKRTKKA
jgi:hypothetical protein